MRQSVNGLIRRKVAFVDGTFKHGANGPKSVAAFQFTPLDPTEYGWPVDQQYPLNMRSERRIQEAN